jgi:predicted CXXCH cytochrome family protein
VKILKRISIVLALSLALCLAFVGSAYANFGPHGGYINDTDSCAGCHRAHTSFSTVGWQDNLGTDHTSALLVGSASTMTEFCNACHGDTAPGASTNVASGVFDSGPSASSSGTVGAAGDTTGSDGGVVTSMYKTASTFNAPLNGGGFNRMPDPYAWQSSTSISYKAASSAHKMDVSGPLWGSGVALSAVPTQLNLTCTDCHDPHGTSNYRLLKAQVNGVTVGGYDSNDVPTPIVFSNEVGYPVPVSVANPGGGVQVGSLPNGGWLKHQAGADQMALYRPNYTDTNGTPILHTDASTTSTTKSMSTWCSACHTNYNQTNAASAVSYNYSPYLPGVGSAAQVGTKDYHRHAVNQTMAAGIGAGRSLAEQVVQDSAWVPLENPGSGGDWSDGYLGCLTCHRAHGSSVDMTGWAAAHLTTNTAGVYIPVIDAVPGVDPAKNSTTGGTSSLLRANNRGVCERCHNK